VGGTIAFVLSYATDVMFDLSHGTDTVTWVPLKGLTVLGDNRDRAVDYQPTQVLPLRWLFRTLELPGGKTLVDLGCGKGRVLLVASEAGFKEVRGVEFSPELCEIAAGNCAKFFEKKKPGMRFRIVESDVVDYAVQADEDVFFMFNPFDAHVLNIVMRRIVTSLAERRRQIWIIYRNPVHEDVFAEFPEFARLDRFVNRGSDFSVYTNADLIGG